MVGWKSHTSHRVPNGRGLTQFLYQEATRSIATPPSIDASPLQGYSQCFVAGTHLYTWEEKDNVAQSCLSTETT